MGMRTKVQFIYGLMLTANIEFKKVMKEMHDLPSTHTYKNISTPILVISGLQLSKPLFMINIYNRICALTHTANREAKAHIHTQGRFSNCIVEDRRPCCRLASPLRRQAALLYRAWWDPAGLCTKTWKGYMKTVIKRKREEIEIDVIRQANEWVYELVWEIETKRGQGQQNKKANI